VRQSVILSDLVGRLDKLDVRCTRCTRHGRVKLAKLIAEHGPDLGLPELAVRLAADCPNATSTDSARRCWVHFPQLVKLTATHQPAPK
jgi:hypothetical protein